MPSLSPNGKRIVFARTLHDGTKAGRKTELFVAKTAGGEALRLTENTVEDINPVWSPDGKTIAFGEVNASNRGTIDLIGADGSNQRIVTSTGREYPDPDYSPNGRNLAFIGEVPNAPHGYESAIYTVRISGAARNRVPSPFEIPELPQWTLRP
jgi:Tol biopolymer transport system component